MKMLIFWVASIIAAALLCWFYDKTSILTTVFDVKVSSPWFDLALIVILGYTVVLRSISFYTKLLK